MSLVSHSSYANTLQFVLKFSTIYALVTNWKCSIHYYLAGNLVRSLFWGALWCSTINILTLHFISFCFLFVHMQVNDVLVSPEALRRRPCVVPGPRIPNPSLPGLSRHQDFTSSTNRPTPFHWRTPFHHQFLFSCIHRGFSLKNP